MEHERRMDELKHKIESEKAKRKNMNIDERMLEKGYRWVDGEGYLPVDCHVDELQNAIDERDKLMRQ